ncbi:hypothetical protein FGO68_gene6136 [Halteria grandinella]|uniref:RING-type domain-containing protein n=1 Tax=Halteria grandinella TaxID=5974 RepID=A0A8J8NLK1_HALGN|nr:hypothetical protein FGO68_gene6136 [Halteria grandinella]
MVYDERKARKQDQVQRRQDNLPQDPLERPLLNPQNDYKPINIVDPVQEPVPSGELELLHMDPKDLHTRECVICCDRDKDTAFVPCGHLCCCQACAKQFMRQALHKYCPICRNRIKETIKVYVV